MSLSVLPHLLPLHTVQLLFSIVCFGITTSTQSLKMYNGFSFQLQGTFTVVRDVQSLKAEEAIVVTLSGISIVSSTVQFIKAYLPIVVAPFSITTFVILFW